MKVSLNWIKQFIDFDLPPIGELEERIGSQLGAIEGVENLGEKYRGVLVVKVVSCVDHPDSDHMHVCMIDDGGKAQDVERNANGHVQVVCGAPNVREGITVAWLPPGSTVPESVGTEPFVLGARNLRGVMSNGMLASKRELALGEDHDGILEIDKDVEPGSDFAAAYKLDDYILELENKMFTHRPDCFGALGVAREIAGILGHTFTSPDWYQPNPIFAGKIGDLPLQVTNELPELAPRFTAITLSNVTLGPSPVWLQAALAKVGQKSISNIVDLTNFYMLVTGQPLHAYDYDKVKALTGGEAAQLTVRNPRSGETIALLNGKTIEPRAEAIMIASGDHLIGVGGVMGGADTEVSSETKNIILEAATFDMYSIRRTSMAHGLFTDAVTRFNKGQSPLQNLAVLAKITSDIQELANGEVASELIDINHVQGREWVHPPVPVTTSFVNARLGFNLSPDDMKQLLENVEFQVQVESENLTIIAPFWRTDIETREDVVEEIGRLYGFDKLPVDLPRRSIKPAAKDAMLELKQQIRASLAKGGANEVLTYSFVHGNLLEKAGQDKEQAFKLSNALSPDLQYYRLSLTPSLLDKIHPNSKAGYDEFAIFEIGKAHNLQHANDDDGLPTEFEMLDLVYAASEKAGKAGAAFYEAREFLVNLLATFGLEAEFRPIESEEDYQVAKPYDHTRSAQVFVKGTDLPLGMVGEYKSSVRKALKLPKYCAGFGIGITQLMQASAQTGSSYVPIPRFPKVTQDITLKVPSTVLNGSINDLFYAAVADYNKQNYFASAQATSIYQGEDTQFKNVSYNLSIASYEKTMTDQEVSKLLDEIAAAAKEKFGAERV